MWTFKKYSHTEEEIKQMEELGLRPILMLSNDGYASILDEEGVVARIAPRKEGVPKGKLFCTEDRERDANADLIAAAPDLLEALKSVTTSFRAFGGFAVEESSAYNRALDIIAKAEGHTQ